MHSLIVAWLSQQASRKLGEVQRALEKQNGTVEHPPIAAFLISNEEHKTMPGAADTPEQIFVSEDADDPRMGVFICKETLERVAKNGLDSLHDYCVVAEGVSHFIYLASADRPVKLLELELQAEVDKYVHLTDKLGITPGTSEQRALHDRIFERYALHKHLSDEEVERYEMASKAAAKFTYRISQDATRFYDEARSFFSLHLEEKLRRAV
jgi:hypothetical protein